MITAALAFALFGAGAGAAGGASSAAEKERLAKEKFDYATDMLDSTKKMTAAKRTTLSGNLTLQALSNTASSKKNAIAEYQANSAQKGNLGVSGLSSGTPFYKLATDIQERRGQILDSLKAGDIQMGMAKANAEAEAISLDMADAAAAEALLTAGDEYAYADSFVAYALSIASRAANGASMANNLMTLGVQTRALSEDFLGSSLFGGGEGASVEGLSSVAPYQDPSNLWASDPLASRPGFTPYEGVTDSYTLGLTPVNKPTAPDFYGLGYKTDQWWTPKTLTGGDKASPFASLWGGEASFGGYGYNALDLMGPAGKSGKSQTFGFLSL